MSIKAKLSEWGRTFLYGIVAFFSVGFFGGRWKWAKNKAENLRNGGVSKAPDLGEQSASEPTRAAITTEEIVALLKRALAMYVTCLETELVYALEARQDDPQVFASYMPDLNEQYSMEEAELAAKEMIESCGETVLFFVRNGAVYAAFDGCDGVNISGELRKLLTPHVSALVKTFRGTTADAAAMATSSYITFMRNFYATVERHIGASVEHRAVPAEGASAANCLPLAEKLQCTQVVGATLEPAKRPENKLG
jgi:hypothetical protein